MVTKLLRELISMGHELGVTNCPILLLCYNYHSPKIVSPYAWFSSFPGRWARIRQYKAVAPQRSALSLNHSTWLASSPSLAL